MKANTPPKFETKLLTPEKRQRLSMSFEECNNLTERDLKCPHCDEKIEIYGKSKIDAIAAEYGVKTVAKLPINPEVASAVDAGAIETVDVSPLSECVDMLSSL